MVNIRKLQCQEFLDWAAMVFYYEDGLVTNFKIESCHVIGVDMEVDGKLELIAVIIFHNFLLPHKMEISIATKSPKWCTRRVLFECFDYCFNIAKINRIYTQVMASNKKALDMNRRLGFEEVAVLPEFTPDAEDKLHDNHVFTMTREQCRWINGNSSKRG